jgi:hypothetical protein
MKVHRLLQRTSACDSELQNSFFDAIKSRLIAMGDRGMIPSRSANTAISPSDSVPSAIRSQILILNVTDPIRREVLGVQAESIII